MWTSIGTSSFWPSRIGSCPISNVQLCPGVDLLAHFYLLRVYHYTRYIPGASLRPQTYSGLKCPEWLRWMAITLCLYEKQTFPSPSALPSGSFHFLPRIPFCSCPCCSSLYTHLSTLLYLIFTFDLRSLQITDGQAHIFHALFMCPKYDLTTVPRDRMKLRIIYYLCAAMADCTASSTQALRSNSLKPQNSR